LIISNYRRIIALM